jgi:hypothetical protein
MSEPVVRAMSPGFTPSAVMLRATAVVPSNVTPAAVAFPVTLIARPGDSADAVEASPVKFEAVIVLAAKSPNPSRSTSEFVMLVVSLRYRALQPEPSLHFSRLFALSIQNAPLFVEAATTGSVGEFCVRNWTISKNPMSIGE